MRNPNIYQEKFYFSFKLRCFCKDEIKNLFKFSNKLFWASYSRIMSFSFILWKVMWATLLSYSMPMVSLSIMVRHE